MEMGSAPPHLRAPDVASLAHPLSQKSDRDALLSRQSENVLLYMCHQMYSLRKRYSPEGSMSTTC